MLIEAKRTPARWWITRESQTRLISPSRSIDWLVLLLRYHNTEFKQWLVKSRHPPGVYLHEVTLQNTFITMVTLTLMYKVYPCDHCPMLSARVRNIPFRGTCQSTQKQAPILLWLGYLRVGWGLSRRYYRALESVIGFRIHRKKAQVADIKPIWIPLHRRTYFVPQTKKLGRRNAKESPTLRLRVIALAYFFFLLQRKWTPAASK